MIVPQIEAGTATVPMQFSYRFSASCRLPGVYFVRLRAGERSVSGKVLIVP